MSGGTWVFYNHMAERMFDGGVDFDTNTLRVVLVTSAYTFDATHTAWSSASAAEVANGNGYATHGVALASPAVTQTAGVGMIDAADPDWTASGAGITARRAIIVQDADGNGALASTDLLIAAVLLDATPADVTVAAGNHLTVQLSALGIAQITLA